MFPNHRWAPKTIIHLSIAELSHESCWIKETHVWLCLIKEKMLFTQISVMKGRIALLFAQDLLKWVACLQKCAFRTQAERRFTNPGPGSECRNKQTQIKSVLCDNHRDFTAQVDAVPLVVLFLSCLAAHGQSRLCTSVNSNCIAKVRLL